MPIAPLRRAGGSVMVTIPPLYLKENSLSAGEFVTLEMKGDALTIKPVARKPITLAEIISGTPKKLARSRAKGWDELAPAGKEL